MLGDSFFGYLGRGGLRCVSSDHLAKVPVRLEKSGEGRLVDESGDCSSCSFEI